MTTPHIEAKKEDIASRVLLPGDPLRAKYIAENYLEDLKLVNNVRGMLAYTGKYNNKNITVMGTGMGIPSMSIYAHELINVYGVKRLIRVGSCGSYQSDVKVRDIILAMGASTDSNIANHLDLNGTYSATGNFKMINEGYNYCIDNDIKVHVGDILTSDIFYDFDPMSWDKWRKLGVLAVEMETYGLYLLAKKYNVEALSILTVADSLVDGTELNSKERQNSFNDMMKIALEII